MKQYLNSLYSETVSRETCWQSFTTHRTEDMLEPMRCVGATRRVFFVFPLHPTPEGGCSNRLWEASSSCVSMIIWALQRSTLKADMFSFFFLFGVSLESCGIPRGSELWICNKINHLWDVKDGFSIFYRNNCIICNMQHQSWPQNTPDVNIFYICPASCVQTHYIFHR